MEFTRAFSWTIVVIIRPCLRSCPSKMFFGTVLLDMVRCIVPFAMGIRLTGHNAKLNALDNHIRQHSINTHIPMLLINNIIVSSHTLINIITQRLWRAKNVSENRVTIQRVVILYCIIIICYWFPHRFENKYL